jgi:hypothetical protein
MGEDFGIALVVDNWSFIGLNEGGRRRFLAGRVSYAHAATCSRYKAGRFYFREVFCDGRGSTGRPR